MQVPNQLHTYLVTRSSPWQLVAGSLARQQCLVLSLDGLTASPLPTEHGQDRQEGLWVCQDPHPAAPGGAAAHAAGMLLLQYQKLSLQNEPASSEEPFGFPIVRGHNFQGRQLADGELLAGSREH